MIKRQDRLGTNIKKVESRRFPHRCYTLIAIIINQR